MDGTIGLQCVSTRGEPGEFETGGKHVICAKKAILQRILCVCRNGLRRDFCSGKPRITINEYAFKGSAITITCEYTQAYKVNYVALGTPDYGVLKNQSDAFALDNVFELYADKRDGVNKRGLNLLSDPKNLRLLRLNLTRVQCSDALEYGCLFFSNAEFRRKISDLKILKVIEPPSKPRISLIGSPLCADTKNKCEDCRRGSKKLPGQRFGEIIQIQCSNTVPKIGSLVFQWFYKDGHGKYQQITENVTDDKPSTISPTAFKHINGTCVESQVITSRLMFQPDPFQNYGSNLVLRCNTTYRTPGTAKELINYTEIEICIIGLEEEQDDIPQLKLGKNKNKHKRRQNKVGIIIGAVAGGCLLCLILIDTVYYFYQRNKMVKKLEIIKASKTSPPADISFTSVRSEKIREPIKDEISRKGLVAESKEPKRKHRRRRKRRLS